MAFAVAMSLNEPQAPPSTGPQRTCIATGETAAPERMIRFVVGPEGDVVPDLARRLPGRGMWVKAERCGARAGRGEEPVRQGSAGVGEAARPTWPSGSSGCCWSGRWPISAGRAGPAVRSQAS